MKIAELTDPTKNLNIDLKIIFDQTEVQEKWGHKIKAVIVADADGEQGGPTAFLDLYDKDIELYKFKDKLKVVNGYAKMSKNKRKQFRIGYGFSKGELIGKYEKIE